MELWDAYDVRGNSLEHTLIRGEEVPAGEYHLLADILVRHTDGSFLLTQRDPQKPAFPGCWELSAGGSVLAGETALSGAMRELREETGIQADALAPAFDTVVNTVPASRNSTRPPKSSAPTASPSESASDAPAPK